MSEERLPGPNSHTCPIRAQSQSRPYGTLTNLDESDPVLEAPPFVMVTESSMPWHCRERAASGMLLLGGLPASPGPQEFKRSPLEAVCIAAVYFQALHFAKVPSALGLPLLFMLVSMGGMPVSSLSPRKIDSY